MDDSATKNRTSLPVQGRGKEVLIHGPESAAELGLQRGALQRSREGANPTVGPSRKHPAVRDDLCAESGKALEDIGAAALSSPPAP